MIQKMKENIRILQFQSPEKSGCRVVPPYVQGHMTFGICQPSGIRNHVVESVHVSLSADSGWI